MCLTIFLFWGKKSNTASQPFCVFPPAIVPKKLYGFPTFLGTHTLYVSSDRILYRFCHWHLTRFFFGIRIVLVDAPFSWILF